MTRTSGGAPGVLDHDARGSGHGPADDPPQCGPEVPVARRPRAPRVRAGAVPRVLLVAATLLGLWLGVAAPDVTPVAPPSLPGDPATTTTVGDLDLPFGDDGDGPLAGEGPSSGDGGRFGDGDGPRGGRR
jgi:hypothetical protein